MLYAWHTDAAIAAETFRGDKALLAEGVDDPVDLFMQRASDSSAGMAYEAMGSLIYFWWRYITSPSTPS